MSLRHAQIVQWQRAWDNRGHSHTAGGEQQTAIKNTATSHVRRIGGYAGMLRSTGLQPVRTYTVRKELLAGSQIYDTAQILVLEVFTESCKMQALAGPIELTLFTGACKS